VRVAVLGGTRFIGRAAVEDLVGAGHEVLVVHRGELEPDGMPAVEHLHTDRSDLRRHADALATFGPDAALDCRALTRIDAATALAALPRDVRIVVISSIDVYRAFGAVHDGGETDPVPIDETSPVRSERYPYRGRMPGFDDYDKLDVEDVYLAAGATSLRLPMVYGEHDYQRREDFILRRVRAGRTRIPIGAGNWLTCRGYVRDIGRGIRLALEQAKAMGQAVNLCEDKTYSVRLWAEMILEAAGSDARLVRVPDDRLPPDLEGSGATRQHILATARKARDLFGWTTSDPAESLRTTVRWHLEHPPADSDMDFSADDRALEAAI
jgi:nucleoside-diphosphate-sugar epimerase